MTMIPVQNAPPSSKDPRAGWRNWLRNNEPIIDLLTKNGCTRGEAILIVEMNAVEQATEGAVIRLQELIEIMDHSDPPEPWKGEGT